MTDGATVLLIEDSDDVRQAIGMVLRRAGMQPIEAKDGRSGLKLLFERRPDCVILDVGLPDLEGWMVLSRIRDVSDVPVMMLTARHLELDKVRGLDEDLIFPSVQRGKDGKGKVQSVMVFKALFKRMNREGFTTHGFRSTLRIWASERTNVPREIAEMCLAHTVGNAVERAYARSDMFDKRRDLMERWAGFCLSKRSKGKVVELRNG